jgi:hypothetical protein
MKKVALVLVIGSVLCLALFGVLRWNAADWQAPMVEQQAAAQWQGEGETPMVQVSAFLTEERALTATSFNDIRTSIDTALTEAGVDPDETPWVWAASGQTEGTVLYGDNSANVEITAVQGDFFQFHPMVLVSGGYLTSDDLMHDRVVIDQLTAWNLYGSSDAAGMELYWNGQRYVVAGVVQALEGDANERCYGDNTARIYVFSDSDETTEVPLTTAEAILPEPVDDFALAAWKNALGYQNDTDMEFVQNTGRFSFENSLKLAADLSMRGVQLSPIFYPYWESAARLTENHLAILAVESLVALIWPAGSLLFGLIWYERHRKWRLGRDLKLFGSNMVDKHRAKVYYKSDHDEWNV